MKKIIKNIKKNIKIMINKFRNSSKKTKITFLSVVTAFLLIIIFIVFYNVNTNLKADVTITESPDSKIPDKNFYMCVVDNYNGTYDTNLDYTHVFTDEELNNIYSLDCVDNYEEEVETFQGVEKMLNLENFYVFNRYYSGSAYVSIDFSSNKNLKFVHLDFPISKSINLSENSNLEELWLVADENTNLDFSNNKKLNSLSLLYSTREPKTIDLSNNKNLEKLFISGLNISNLDLSNNNKIKKLSLLYQKSLSNLDLTNQLNLEDLWIHDVGVTSLHIGNVQKLEHFSIDSENLTDFQIGSNSTSSIDSLSSLNLSDIPNIENVKIYSLPFKTINISNNPNLKKLSLLGNSLDSIDLSNNSNLETLEIASSTSNISSLDLSHNPKLKELDARSINLSNLDLSNNSNLISLRLKENGLKNLDLSHNANLEFLELSDTKVSNLDLSHNSNLTHAYLSNNVDLDCYGVGCTPAGAIKNLDLSNNSNLVALDLGYNDVDSLDLSHNPKLSYLNLDYNDVNSLDLSHNPDLKYLELDYTFRLNSLDLSHNPDLEMLFLGKGKYQTKLSEIDLSHNPKLVSLDLSGNNLTTLDLSNNSNLYALKLNNAFKNNININVNDTYNLLKLSDTTSNKFGYQIPVSDISSTDKITVNLDKTITAIREGNAYVTYNLPNGYSWNQKVNNKIKYTISNSTAKKDNSKNNIKKMSYIPSNNTLKKLENEQGANDTCSVTFVIDNSQVVKSINCGSTLSDISDIPNPEKEGYRLSYWSTTEDSTGRVFEVDEINTNLVLYPIFEPEVYNVNFYNGNKLIDSVAIDYNTAVTKPETDPTKEGYIFKYWSESENGLEYDFSSAITKNKTLFAVFEAETDRLNNLRMKDDIVKTSLHMTKGILSSTMDLDNIKVLSNNTELNKYKFIKTGDKLVVGNENKDIAVIGDSNKDGNIDIGDLTRTYKIYKKTYTSSDVEKVAADSNEDDTIDIGDLTRTYKLYKKN